MRERNTWYAALVRELSAAWTAESVELDLPRFFQVELGLRLAERIDPDCPAHGVWALLSGYPLAHARGLVRSDEAETMREIVKTCG